MTPVQGQQELRAIVEQYRVCFEVWSLREAHLGRLGTVGFEVDLAGTHGSGKHLLHPACNECRAVYHGLRQLALAAIPATQRASRVELMPFDASIHSSPARGFRDDIELHMLIVHRLQRELPIDDSERACLHGITESLKRLGVREGSWMMRA